MTTNTKLQQAWFAELRRAEEAWRQHLLDQVYRPDPAKDALEPADMRKALEKVRKLSAHVDEAALARVLEDCLLGLLHSVHVAIDGGSELADTGQVALVDERGVSLGEGLHELFVLYVEERRSKKPRKR